MIVQHLVEGVWTDVTSIPAAAGVIPQLKSMCDIDPACDPDYAGYFRVRARGREALIVAQFERGIGGLNQAHLQVTYEPQ